MAHAPRSSRWSAPRFEHHADSVPVRREPGVERRCTVALPDPLGEYPHYVPTTWWISDWNAAPASSSSWPDSYTDSCMCSMAPSRSAGAHSPPCGQVGWLAGALVNTSNGSALRITAGEDGARLMLYDRQRQVFHRVHGPFVGENREDIRRLSICTGQERCRYEWLAGEGRR